MSRAATYLAQAVCLSLVLLASPAWAQEDEPGGPLIGFLEDTLSGDSRYIKVTGLEGALSSRATIKQISVSDDDGIWLTINNAELDWNRLALLRGRFSVNKLSAQEIILARPPKPVQPDPTLPAPEAQPFQLPDFPVSIELGQIDVLRFELAKPVLGIAAELKMTGALVLADGALDTDLKIRRLDRPTDAISLLARFENETSLITLDLSVTEDQGGLISKALKIPGSPPISLTAAGKGPVADFTADIDLSTAGISRLAGQVRLQEVPTPATDEDSQPGLGFSATLSGDVSTLLATQYQPFFGDLTRLDFVGQRDADGRLEISRFDVSTEALALNGTLNIGADAAIESLQLTGRITPPDGSTVLLPLSGPRTEIAGAQITALLDASQSDEWELALEIGGFSRADLSAEKASVRISGTLGNAEDPRARGRFQADLSGLDFASPDLDQAVGTKVSLAGKFILNSDAALDLSQVSLQGADYSAFLEGRLSGLESGFHMEGAARIGAADLSRFSGLAGRPIGGAINATLSGSGAPLSGQFALRLEALARDLNSGIDQLDPLIGGQTTLVLDAVRNATGLTINSFELEGAALGARASGALSSAGSDFEFEATLKDLALVLPEISGPLKLRGEVSQNNAGTIAGTLRLDGPQTSFLDLDGTLDPGGPASLTYKAQLDRIERFVPEMTGTLTSDGTAKRNGSVWTIDADTKAPAGFKAEIGGTWDEKSGASRVGAKGEIQLAIANRLLKPNSIAGLARFDLTMDGRAGLDDVKGTITTSNAQIVLPGLAQTISNISTRIQLADGRANLSLTGDVAAGGRLVVNGPVSLAPPFQGTLTTDVQQVVLTDNLSYTSVASGQLVFSGPLTGNGNLSGQIVFGETEINLNTASGSAGAPSIPTIVHVGETNAERATRARAGLIKSDGGSPGPVIGLDIILSAPARVFARGRGVQAELGGQIRVRGTTAQVVPAGQIELIRGNMSLLGRKLKLTRGLVSLQGKLEPYVEFAATTSTTDGTATLEISGPLSAPELVIYSEPDRPSEEALAMLVFGNRFAEMSPLAIAQLAASLAELNGRGGGAVGGAREKLGVDALNVGTDEDGAGQVGVGLYVQDNVYTDFTVNTDGDTEVNLNLDVTDNLTLKGTVDNRGATSFGIFFERDY